MNRRFYIKGIVSLSAFALIVPLFVAHAEDNCEFKGSVAALSNKATTTQSVSQDKNTPGEKKDETTPATDELSVRRGALERVVKCIEEGASALQGSVKSASIAQNDANARNVQSSLVYLLGDALTYYGTQRLSIPNLTIPQTKEFARSLKTWRATQYIPLEEQSIRFALWGKTHGLMLTSQKRLDSVKETIKKLSLSDRKDIQELIASAEKHIANASLSHAQARARFLVSNEKKEDAMPLIKSALASLAESYRSFFSLSELINTILPHESPDTSSQDDESKMSPLS